MLGHRIKRALGLRDWGGPDEAERNIRYRIYAALRANRLLTPQQNNDLLG